MGIPFPRSRRLFRPLLVAAAAALTLLAVIAPASAGASPSCALAWGSGAEHGSTTGPVAGATVHDVRSGRHDCYDRLVVDIRGASSLSSWRVEYVDRVTEDPSGRAVPLRGGAFLRIVVGASDHTPDGRATYSPADRRELANVGGYRTFRQVAWAGSFEGVSSVGLGVRGRLPFRVLPLAGSPGTADGVRLAIDVAHHW